ncbi:MAG: hypothetical protein JWN41_1842 [Thermoleophilia bacterium]|nr:hypothetical protein [Thermoleophilia bacterium]
MAFSIPNSPAAERAEPEQRRRVEKVHARPMASVSFMGTALRRKRGTGIGNVQTNYAIPKDCKDKLHEVSERMGLSDAQGLELILNHLELEQDGLPTWVDRESLQEALPIAKAS